MPEFFKSYTFIVGFLLAMIFFGATLGERAVRVLAACTLLSMIVLNSEKIKRLLQSWNDLA